MNVAKELVARGADVRARWSPRDKIPDPVEAITLARQNQSILHLAAIEGKPEMLEFLHAQGAELEAKNSMGETPLELADKQERYREAILRQGADGERVTAQLKPAQCHNLIDATMRAWDAGQPFNRWITLLWEKGGIAARDNVKATRMPSRKP